MFENTVREQSRIINYLLSYRILRTHVPKGERFKDEEKNLARALWHASPDTRYFIDEFLAETGFRIVNAEASQTPGLPPGSVYFLLIRDPEENVPAWLDIRHLYKYVSLKDNESKLVTRVWFFFIWSNMLTLLYTHRSRPITNISGYGAANISKETLINQVKTTIEEVRQDSFKETSNILMQEEGNTIARRVGRFLDFMCSISYLEEEKDGDEIYYGQTLLMATELSENYESGLGYRDNLGSDVRENVQSNLFAAEIQEDLEGQE